MLLDDRTRGVDAARKTSIYVLLRSLGENGVLLVLVSDELMSAADRNIVFKGGQLVCEFDNYLRCNRSFLTCRLAEMHI